MQNNSNVKVDIQDAFFLMQQIAPLSDEFVEAYNAGAFVDESPDSIQWPILDEVELSWERNELIVEPGESHRETLDFVVSKNVESVRVYTYFYNPNYLQGETSQGWEAITAYDLARKD